MNIPSLRHQLGRIRQAAMLREEGEVIQVVGLVVEAYARGGVVGDTYEILPSAHAPPILAEVVGFRDERVLLMPVDALRGVGAGCRVRRRGGLAAVAVGEKLLGRVIDPLGRPLDDRGTVHVTDRVPLHQPPIPPLRRRPIDTILTLGIRSIDGLLTLGRGQRVGIFAGAGIGKSTLIGTMARSARVDVSVIALIGERGREVGDFVRRILGPDGLARSVVVVATSDRSPLEQVRGAFAATAIAEWLRDRGANVLLVMDSLTRFAMAQRQIGLAIGEPPTTKGYTPSVFALLPRLLERVAPSDTNGSITGLYTVLVEGDDMSDPVADAARSVLDGHIVMSRELAEQGHHPAIDVLASVSRVMSDVVSPAHLVLAQRIRSLIATAREAQDLVNLGAYVAGSNPRIDEALKVKPALDRVLRQRPDESSTLEETLRLFEQALTEPGS
ncbi:MAG: FliI/YscN family ATPase [Myxococcales bacterium]|nr:FliI/YscN family ATPase [Myxococcota bacterium]MDW8282820.1 FliI/YscN family ATPase [Myxococcales bacterium]